MMPSTTVIPVRLGMVNAYIVRGEGTVLIDTGLPGNEAAICTAVQNAGVALEEVSLIVLTHGHQDHAGSAARFREMTGAAVAAHQGDAEKLRSGRSGPLKALGITGMLFGAFIGMNRGDSYPPCEPDLLITGPLDLQDYGIDGMVVPTPGHTPGSVSVLLGGDAVTGDLIFPSFPSGRPGLPFWADDVGQVKESIRTVLSYHPTMIYPGHGRPFPADGLQRLLS